MSIKDDLNTHYSKKSKHSNYQVLPPQLKELIRDEDVETKSRFEGERFDYLLSKLSFKNKTVLDIGGNTGYFTFRVVEKGAIRAVHYEGNADHSRFVELAAKALDMTDRIRAVNGYYNFEFKEYSQADQYDIALLFNVLHHFGDDYGDKGASIELVKKTMIEHINMMATITDTLVLQIGFNSQGDASKPLFKNGTKSEMIDFICTGVRDTWEIAHIGIAEKRDGQCAYYDLDSANIERDDSLGEFLNRPIFILSAKRL